MIKRLLLILLLMMLLLCVVIFSNTYKNNETTFEAEGIIVVEVVPNNKRLKHDEFMDFGDYIKIFNNSPDAINLENYSLTDDFRSPDKWIFPSFDLEPYKELYVFLDGKDLKAHYFHTNFSLNNEGEEILFNDNEGNILFSWVYDRMDGDVSYSYSNNQYKLISNSRNDAKINVNDFKQYMAINEDNAVSFSVDSGFYTNEFELILSTENANCVIHYTFDGSDPTFASNIYTSPIKITSRDNDQNDFISSSVAYEESEESANFTPDPKLTKRATVIKACAFIGGVKVGEVFTNTYFVDEKGDDLYSLSVVSLVCDPDDLFSSDKGIYVVGNAYEGRNNVYEIKSKSTPANYNQRGEEWRRSCSFEYFEDCKCVYEQKLGIQIFGGSSRGERKKSFKLLTKTFSDQKIQYPFFDELQSKSGTPIDAFDELILRSSGGSFRTNLSFLDSLHSSIASKNLDTQASRNVIVFLNGNYYGIYQLMEVLSGDYISSHYEVNKENVEIFKTLDYDQGVVQNRYYKELLEFAENHDLSESSNYEFIADKIDIDNMLEYFVFQMYIANTDWPGANNKIWRVIDDASSEHSKYKYVLYDTDAGMNMLGDFRFDDLHPTMFHWVFENKYSNYEKLNIHSLEIIEKLIMNQGFKQAFINKFCDRVNYDYTPEIFNERLDYYISQLGPEIEDDLVRYNFLYSEISRWYGFTDTYRNYVSTRFDKVFIEMSEYFHCDIGYLNILHSKGGFVDINSNIQVAQYKDFSGRYMSNVDIVLTPVANEGYQFVGWSDGDKTTTRHISFNKDMLELSLRAIFEKDE